MSGKAFLLTSRRLTDDHYLAISLRGARDMQKPPITLSNFWKHAIRYDDPSAPMSDLCSWLTREAEIGDYVVLEGVDSLVKELTVFAKNHRLVPVAAIWEPEAAIRDL